MPFPLDRCAVPSGRRVLLVGTHPDETAERLRAAGFSVEWTDGRIRPHLSWRRAFDALVVDGDFPAGVNLCRSFRREGRSTPVLVVTGVRGHRAQAELLAAGADECLGASCAAEDVPARVDAQLRRVARAARSFRQVGDVSVDLTTAEVRCGDEPVSLPPQHYRLLAAMAQRPGATLSRADLARSLWGVEGGPHADRGVETLVAGLRRRLEDDPRHPRRIVTVRGSGYRLVG